MNSYQRIWMVFATAALVLLAIIAYSSVAMLQLSVSYRDTWFAYTLTMDAVLAGETATADAVGSSRNGTATAMAARSTAAAATAQAEEPADLAYSTGLAQTMTTQAEFAAATNTAAAQNDLLTATEAP